MRQHHAHCSLRKPENTLIFCRLRACDTCASTVSVWSTSRDVYVSKGLVDSVATQSPTRGRDRYIHAGLMSRCGCHCGDPYTHDAYFAPQSSGALRHRGCTKVPIPTDLLLILSCVGEWAAHAGQRNKRSAKKFTFALSPSCVRTTLRCSAGSPTRTMTMLKSIVQQAVLRQLSPRSLPAAPAKQLLPWIERAKQV